ncbi:MAG: SRPBCC family protein [Natronosporangium sp.]
MAEQTPPQIEVTVAAPPEAVWPALRDPALIRRWHGWQFEGDAGSGGGLDEEVRVIYTTGVTEDTATRVLTLADGDQFSLHPVAGGTVVRVTRAPRGGNPDWDAYYDDITEGWWTFLQQLRFAIERHDLAERRTLVLEGQLTGAVSPVDALGLAQVAAQPPGSPYRAVLDGEELRGSVWARAPRQLVLTVDGFGDGLLVLAEQPPNPDRPDGGAMLLLTAYGLDDRDFQAVRDRWSGWWAARSGPRS